MHAIIIAIIVAIVLPPPGPTKQELEYDQWAATHRMALAGAATAVLMTWDADRNSPPDLASTGATIRAADQIVLPHDVPPRRVVIDVRLMIAARSLCRAGAAMYQSTDHEDVRRLGAVALLSSCILEMR